MSFLKIKNEYFRTPEYIDFFKDTKSVVYYFLLSAIIRESKEVKNPHHGAHYIYKKHFLKGELVSRYSQENMRVYLKTSQPAISRYLKHLEQDGLIKKIIRSTKKYNALYYQLGVWEGDFGKDSYKETLWSDVIFTSCYEAFQKRKENQRKKENYDELLDMFDGDKDEFDLYLNQFDID